MMIAYPQNKQLLIVNGIFCVCVWSGRGVGVGYAVLISRILVVWLINDLCTVTLALDLDLLT